MNCNERGFRLSFPSRAVTSWMKSTYGLSFPKNSVCCWKCMGPFRIPFFSLHALCSQPYINFYRNGMSFTIFLGLTMRSWEMDKIPLPLMEQCIFVQICFSSGPCTSILLVLFSQVVPWNSEGDCFEFFILPVLFLVNNSGVKHT